MIIYSVLLMYLADILASFWLETKKQGAILTLGGVLRNVKYIVEG